MTAPIRIPMKKGKIEVTISATPTQILGVQSLGIPQKMADRFDETCLEDDSHTDDGTEVNYGDIEIDLLLDLENTVHKYLWDAIGSGTKEAFLITLPNTAATKFAITGPVLTMAGAGGDSKAKVKAKVTIHADTCVINPS